MIRVAVLLAVLVISGCGGSSRLGCDEGPYQAAIRAPKVKAPDGLDDLDPINEMPLPQASPREARPADGPCLESPPEIIRIE